MIRPKLCIALLLAVSTLSSLEFVTADEDAASAADLKAVQGLWERDLTDRQGRVVGRATKDVFDRQETITYFDNDGRLLRAHRVTITLRREGGVRIFAHSPIEIIAGDQKGAKSTEGGSYIYKVQGDVFLEIQGVLIRDGDQPAGILAWKKALPKEA